MDFVFPDVAVGQEAAKMFKIVNDTGHVVQLQSHVSCGCTSVALAHPYLREGDSSLVQVAYNSAIEPKAGLISRQFTIADTSGPKSEILVSGNFSVMVDPGLALSPSRVAVRFDPDGGNHIERTVTLANQTARDLSLHLLMRGDTMVMDLKPNTLNLPAFSAQSVMLNFNQKLPGVPLRQTVFINANDAKDPAFALNRMLTVELMPRRLLQANPGSLIFGPADVRDGRVTQKFQFIMDSKNAADITSVTSTSSSVRITQWNQQGFQISVAKQKQGVVTNASIVVHYGKHHQHQLEIPIIGMF